MILPWALPLPLPFPFDGPGRRDWRFREADLVNQRTTRKSVSPFQTIFEFADIPGPVISQHGLEAFVAQNFLLTGSSQHAFQEIHDQEEYLAGARAGRESAGRER